MVHLSHVRFGALDSSTNRLSAQPTLLRQDGAILGVESLSMPSLSSEFPHLLADLVDSFVMPAVFDSLVTAQGLSDHQAWRVAYIVPFVIITTVAIGMLFLCEDAPTGKWSERHLWAKENATSILSPDGNTIDIHSGLSSSGPSAPGSVYNITPIDVEKKGNQTPTTVYKGTSAMGQIDALKTDGVVSPTRKETFTVSFSLSTMAVAIPYACSFGSELAINSVLGTYYEAKFPTMGQTETGRWAAMFGLLNVICRPAGGFVADILYRHTGHVWSKRLLLSSLGLIMGAFQLAIGLSNPSSDATMFGLMAGLAFFLEACNGANFAVVPHVHPYANGIVSGLVGGFGNLGGIVFAIVFRYNGVEYGRSLWVIGVISLVANLAVGWIHPVSRKPVIQS